MSKLFCKECNLIYDEKEIDKLHKETNLTNHHYIKESNNLEIMTHLCEKIKHLETKIEENYKVESELLYMIQENRTLLNLFRADSQISIVHPEFELLNCKSIQDKEKCACVMFRLKNIVYMTINFEGKIKETKDTGVAQIIIKMPMWLIYSGSFIVESLYNCLCDEKKIVRLTAKYEQMGNELIININQSDLDIQTYWMKSNKSCNFTIKGNFMIQPPSRRRLGKFYIYNIATNKVVIENNGSLSLVDDWKLGCLLEVYAENSQEKIKINNKFININNDAIKLESNEKNGNEIRYIPGYSDIIQIILFKDNKPMFIEVNGDNIILTENPSDKSQFLIIPESKPNNK